jgi:hypothetical protein
MRTIIVALSLIIASTSYGMYTRDYYDTFGVSVSVRNFSGQKIVLRATNDRVVFFDQGKTKAQNTIVLGASRDFEIAFKGAVTDIQVQILKYGLLRNTPTLLSIGTSNIPDPCLIQSSYKFDSNKSIGYKLCADLCGGGSRYKIMFLSNEKLLSGCSVENFDSYREVDSLRY